MSDAPPRRRAPLFLLLFALTVAAAGRVSREAASAAEVAGVMLFPVLFLGLGVTHAFREPGRGTRVAAIVLATGFVVPFSMGLVRRAERQRGLDEVDAGCDALVEPERDVVGGSKEAQREVLEAGHAEGRLGEELGYTGDDVGLQSVSQRCERA